MQKVCAVVPAELLFYVHTTTVGGWDPIFWGGFGGGGDVSSDRGKQT